MYRRIYQAPVRSEWSEFSLRSRPQKVKRFKAGPSNNSDDESSADLRRKTERNMLRTKPALRNENMEDSIENDAFTIAMSYPEGRQKMMERIDANLFSCHSNKESRTNSLPSRKKYCRKGQISGNIKESQSAPRKEENTSLVSKSLSLEENTPKNESKQEIICLGDQPEYKSLSLEQQKPRARSPVSEKRQGRRKFTAKQKLEKRPPLFTLRDILGKEADCTQSCGCNSDVNRDEQVDLEKMNSAGPLTEQMDSWHYPRSQLNIDDSFRDNADAWIDEFGSKKDSSLLALLESPIVDETSYSTDTEEDSGDAKYYYENMLNRKDKEHGSIGKMRLSHIVSFAHQFRQHCRGKLSSGLEAAIIEALKVCSKRANVSLDGYNDIKRWGLLEMGFLNIIDDAGADVDPFIPKAGSEFPPVIMKELRKLRHAADGSDFDSDEELSNQKEECKTDLMTSSGCFESDVLKDVDFCLSCAKHDRKIVCEHPMFKGFVCYKCKDSLMESLLALDNDGCNLFCAVCGEGGELYVCEEKDCGRSFCARCMKHYLSFDAFKLVRGRSPWLCFLCTKYSLESHGVLLPRDSWQEELIKFYNPVFDQVSPSCDTAYFTGRKLRVLSLFDGIGCVRVALEQLQLDVEVYYASETDAFAQHLTLFNHGFSILHLGDVNCITKDRLQEICPIDLVVACPPSEDLDVTNREYEGFNGTGLLMLKFLMILKDLEIMCKGSNSVYWLIEGSAAMKSEYRKILSNFFQKEPCMWDAQFFSPYVCPKLYWGNIPRLYSSLQYYKDNQEQSTSLESYLAPNVNRSALVKKLRNCAIDMPVVGRAEDKSDDEMLDPEVNKNEILITDRRADVDPAGKTMYSLPVLMGERKTNIWIGEVERVLGLPIHYTDVSRLSLSQRQKLLKHAPSVHMIKHLLSPLTDIYLTYA